MITRFLALAPSLRVRRRRLVGRMAQGLCGNPRIVKAFGQETSPRDKCEISPFRVVVRASSYLFVAIAVAVLS